MSLQSPAHWLSVCVCVPAVDRSTLNGCVHATGPPTWSLATAASGLGKPDLSDYAARSRLSAVAEKVSFQAVIRSSERLTWGRKTDLAKRIVHGCFGQISDLATLCADVRFRIACPSSRRTEVGLTLQSERPTPQVHYRYSLAGLSCLIVPTTAIPRILR